MNRRGYPYLIALLLAACFSAHASPGFQQGNILISEGNQLFEYDLAGNLVSQLTIPASADGGTSRDVTILSDGSLAVYNGTFAPELAVYDGQDWASITIVGWSTANNLTYGGIASFNGKIYLSDMYTASPGDPRGIVVFDSADGSHARYADTNDYIDVIIGRDGLVYGLRNTNGDLDVFDPGDMALLRSVDLGHSSSSRGIAVNEFGDIFMVSLSAYIAHFNAAGDMLNSLQISNYLSDVDINADGQIIIGSAYDQAFLTDETLGSFTALSSPSDNTFVAFVQAPTQAIAPPELEGSHYRKGRWIHTTLSWQTDAPAVDVYFNGEFLETLTGVNSASYSYNKKLDQVFTVCNQGTADCSSDYVAN